MSISDVYRERYSKPGWVYIQGSASSRLLKFGITVNLRRRTGVNRSQKYGGIDDWELLYYVHVEQSGTVEYDALRRLKTHKKTLSSLKDGIRPQVTKEIVDCPFSVALRALEEGLSGRERESSWRSSRTVLFEPEDTFSFIPRAQLVPPTTLPFSWVFLMRIEDLELSVRTNNCLKNEGIVFVGSLVTRSEAEMLRTPNFGRKPLNELKELLAHLNLSFGMDLPNWPPSAMEELSPTISPLMKRVDDLCLSVRSQNALANCGIFYVGELTRLSDAELLQTANFGRRSLTEIQNVLKEIGLRLGTALPNWDMGGGD